MAEAVAALGLAASILQFVDFGSRVASNFLKLYKSNRQDREDVPDLQRINTDLQKLLQNLQVPQAGCSEDTGLAELAKECQTAATDLDTLLKSLFKADTESHGKREALKASLKLVWKENDFRSLQERIDQFRNQLVIHLLTTLREQSHKSLVHQQEILDKLKATDDSEPAGGVSVDSFGDSSFGTCVLDFLANKFERNWRKNHLARLREDLITAICADGETDNNEAYLQRPTISEARWLQLHHMVLHKLSYNGMEDREARIPQAYESTFQWVWEPPLENERTWSSFVDWLGSESQLYWITGKAGSGKSTLMKYITSTNIDVSGQSGHFEADQFRYRACLDHWAKGSKLIVAVFFFWNSGLNLQMTQTGLLRSLLYQILTQAPELLPVAFAGQWEATCLFGAELVWTDQQLQHGLQCVVKSLDSNKKLCMFVDGLDECAGDHSALITLFHELITNPCVKLCVASRPWLAFEDAFRDKPSLMLEDLTYIDIKHYVSSHFYGDPGFSRLQCLEPAYAEQLVNNIVTKSSGVFLWVTLVVTSLLSGMEHGDRVKDIQKRLDLLPSELEQLYGKILQSLNPFYLEHAAQLFELVKCCPTPPSIVFLACVDEAEDTQKVIEQPICTRTPKETEALCESMRRRLNSRCKGFLEIARSIHSSATDTVVKFDQEQRTVQYLHRTVKDYIESEAVQKELRSAMKAAFDPCVQLCAGYLSLIKTVDTRETTLNAIDPIWIYVRNFLMLAKAISTTHSQQMIRLMDELDGTCARIAQSVAGRQTGGICSSLKFGQWVNKFPRDRDTGKYMEECMAPLWDPDCSTFGNHFVSLAIGFGITAYVQQKINSGCLVQRTAFIDHDPESFNRNKIKTLPTPGQMWPLLLDAIILLEVPDRDMVQCLLEKGADPNATVPYVTETLAVWKAALGQAIAYGVGSGDTLCGLNVWFNVVIMMIEKGGGNFTRKQRRSVLAAGARDITEAPKYFAGHSRDFMLLFFRDLGRLDTKLSRWGGFLAKKSAVEEFRRCCDKKKLVRKAISK
ncbi:MAG: hypothetical protein M1822_004640 [Bathelium mastoideum]|nr:MAG: hypothetical protein M1822_004640 [Bathelium mastoideum]